MIVRKCSAEAKLNESVEVDFNEAEELLFNKVF